MPSPFHPAYGQPAGGLVRPRSDEGDARRGERAAAAPRLRRGGRSADPAEDLLGAEQGAAGEDPTLTFHEVGHRRLLEHALDRPRDVAPETLQAAARVLEAGVIGGLEAEHGEELTLDRVGDVGHADLRGVLRNTAPAACSPKALDEAGLVQGSELLFEEPKRDLLRHRDLA